MSGLTELPSDMFEGSGGQFHPFGKSDVFLTRSPLIFLLLPGFEYWTDPSNPQEGFITWQVNGNPTARLGASAVGSDQGAGGTGVSQRLIPEEPMVFITLHILSLSRIYCSRFLRLRAFRVSSSIWEYHVSERCATDWAEF